MRYAITDIHGCSKTFARAVRELNLGPEDELFLLGDYIDRGPDSLGVLEQVWALEKGPHRTVCLRGNHEEMLLDYLAGKLERYEWEPPVSHRYRTLMWLQNLPHYHETPGYILVHAGLDFVRSRDPFDNKYAMLWARYWYDEVNLGWLNGRVILHGHTPEPQPLIERQAGRMDELGRLGIDSGCSQDRPEMGVLTVFNLDTRELKFYPNID